MTETGKLAVAIIGAGWMARQHAEVLGSRDDVGIVGVCDLDRERAAGLADEYGARPFEGWLDMVNAVAPDAVWICTPPKVHLSSALGAFERGLPVYLEKPIARTLDDASAIVAGARRSGVVCAVGYQWHALDVLDDLRAAVGGREIGVMVGESIGPTESRPWFLDREAGGGNLLERGSHHIDLVRTVAGEVTAVQAAASTVPLGARASGVGDIDDAVTLVLHLATGGVATIVVAWTAEGTPGSYFLQVVADGVVLRLDLDPTFRLQGTSGGRPVAATSSIFPLARSIDRFVAAVRGNDPDAVVCTPADALATLAVARAAETALQTGGTVEVKR